MGPAESVVRRWEEADCFPPGVEGYALVRREGDGRVVACFVTSSALSPERRAAVRRDLLRRVLRDPAAEISR